MQRVRVIILLLCFLSCSKTKVDPSSTTNLNQGLTSYVTQWKVTELVQGSTVIIQPNSPGTNYIYFELNPSGRYISDNGVNECNGRYTTDKKTQIDFEEIIICTKVIGDLESYRQFKEILTRDVLSFSVNTDTTLLTFLANSDTYMKLSRLK